MKPKIIIYIAFEKLCRGVVPPFIAILTAFETLLLTRKARGGFQPGAGQAATNTLSISDTNALILSPSRFYRILLVP